MQTLLTCFCLAGGVLAPSQNGGSIEVGKSPDAAGGQLTPSPGNLQNSDVRCGHLQTIHVLPYVRAFTESIDTFLNPYAC